jgi:ElaB/YqjD/DUF883 family membrane-anchored ribosome-binding protein
MKTLHSEIPTRQLAEDFDAVVGQAEQLLKSVAHAGTDEAGALRASVEQRFADASKRLAQLREEALGRASDAAKATDEYVRGSPWQAVGMVAAVAAVGGIIAGLLMARR